MCSLPVWKLRVFSTPRLNVIVREGHHITLWVCASVVFLANDFFRSGLRKCRRLKLIDNTRIRINSRSQTWYLKLLLPLRFCTGFELLNKEPSQKAWSWKVCLSPVRLNKRREFGYVCKRFNLRDFKLDRLLLEYCDTFFYMMAKSPQATSITIPEQNVFAHLQLRSATPGMFVNYVGMFWTEQSTAANEKGTYCG